MGAVEELLAPSSRYSGVYEWLLAPLLPLPTTDSIPFFVILIAVMSYDTQGEPLPLTMAPLKPKIDKRKQGRVKKFLQEPVRKVVHKQRVSGWKVRIRWVCGWGLESQSTWHPLSDPSTS